MPKYVISPALGEKIYQRKEKGESIAAIAKTLNISVHTVYYAYWKQKALILSQQPDGKEKWDKIAPTSLRKRFYYLFTHHN